MAATPPRLPFLLSIIRALAQIQFVLSALGLVLFCFFGWQGFREQAFDLPSVMLEVPHARGGQLGPLAYDSLRTSPAPMPYQLAPVGQKLALVYRERDWGKRLGLVVLGLTNHASSRTSLPGGLYSLFTALLLYRILRDTRLESPFTTVNARRIRWLGLLMIGLDAYQYLAFAYLRAIVPALPGPAGPLMRFAVLDTAADAGSWKFGVVLLVVAAVYQRGVAMAQEAELTI